MNRRIRVGVLLFKGNEMLVVRMHRENGNDVFVLPGGGVENDEGLVEAAIRETKEETNLDINIRFPVYLKELYNNEEQSLEVIFLGDIIDGTLQTGSDPEEKGKNILKDVQFIDVKELDKLNFHPKQIKSILKEDHSNNFIGKTRYLGRFRYPED